MTTPMRKDPTKAGINHSSKSQETRTRPSNLSLGGPTGPTTQRGKQKSRFNATKHGIFMVGLVPKRESPAEYRRIVEGLVETLQPLGRLEVILVEKLAMFVWRFRRLLQAEAAEISREATSAEERNVKDDALQVSMTSGRLGLILTAFADKSKVALVAIISRLKGLRQRISERGLDWERDRDALTEPCGIETEAKENLTPQQEGKETVRPEPAGSMARTYRELGLMNKEGERPTGLPSEPAKLAVGTLTEVIEIFEATLHRWHSRSDERNQLQATAALVPRPQVADRLQRYEGSLERAFDRTLLQLERLQRQRLGHPVPPPLKLVCLPINFPYSCEHHGRPTISPEKTDRLWND